MLGIGNVVYFIIILVLSTTFVRSTAEFGEECYPKTKVCDVDPNKCLKQMRVQETYIEECAIRIGPGPIFKDRGDVKFWISIFEEERDLYPVNITYSIYRKFGEGWNNDTVLQPIEGCCDMTLEKSCTLPRKKKESEEQMIYVAMGQKPSDYSWFCEWRITELENTFKYCETKGQIGCYEFKNGILRKNIVADPLTTANYSPAGDFCFFALPNGDPEMISKVEIFEIAPIENFSNSNQSKLTREDVDCLTVHIPEGSNRRVINILEDKDLIHEDVVCFFLRIPIRSDVILEGSEILCLRTKGDRNTAMSNYRLFFYPAAFGMALIFIIATLIVVLRKRNKQTQRNLKKRLKVMPHNLLAITKDYEADEYNRDRLSSSRELVRDEEEYFICTYISESTFKNDQADEIGTVDETKISGIISEQIIEEEMKVNKFADYIPKKAKCLHKKP